MKTYTLIFTGAIVIINAAALLGAFAPYQRLFITVTLALAVWMLLRMLLDTRQQRSPRQREEANEYELPPEDRPPEPEPPRADASVDWDRAANQAATTLLAQLQEKGRLIDFLMEDLSRADDAAVGAAARVVHEGCRSALLELGSPKPVTDAKEGTTVSVDPDDPRFRLSGKLEGTGPFSGKVLHHGWLMEDLHLPRPVDPQSDSVPPVAPAQVEVSG